MSADSLFTFANLGTVGGASLLCFFIVAYTKGIIDRFLPWVPTNVYAVVVAAIILFLVQINSDWHAIHSWQTYFLSAANGILVSATASHTNEMAKRFPTLIKINQDEDTEKEVVLNESSVTPSNTVSVEKTADVSEEKKTGV